MATSEDLRRLAVLTGLRISDEDLERLAPLLAALYAELDRLMALPIAGLEPAFSPRLPGFAPPEAGRRP